MMPVLHAEMSLATVGLVVCVAVLVLYCLKLLLVRLWRGWVAEDPEKPKLIFVAIRNLVMRGSERVAVASSINMARRIANALNEYEPNEKGV